jgi:hypothetical protein
MSLDGNWYTARVDVMAYDPCKNQFWFVDVKTWDNPGLEEGQKYICQGIANGGNVHVYSSAEGGNNKITQFGLQDGQLLPHGNVSIFYQRNESTISQIFQVDPGSYPLKWSPPKW